MMPPRARSLPLSILVAVLVGWAALPAAVARAQDDLAGLAQMLARINQMRSAVGLAALTRGAELDAAAVVHSADMAATERLEHVSATTGDPTSRLAAAGVRGVQIAENIALHADVMSAHAALVASESHRTNLMSAGFTRIGLAAARSPRGVYVTQLFAASPAEPPAPPAPALVPAEPAPAPVPSAVGDAAAGVAPAVPPVAAEPAPAAIPPAPAGPEAAPVPTSAAVPTAPIGPGARRVAGYWVFSQQRWWYYPLPADARAGQVLQPAALPPGAAPPGYTSPGPAAYGTAVARPSPAWGVPPAYVTTPGAVYGQPGAVYGQPGAVYGQPGAVYGQPGAVYGQPGAVYGQPGAVYAPRRVVRAPAFDWSPRRHPGRRAR